ncbi:unnamed protein product [Musa hybrid cultivar]
MSPRRSQNKQPEPEIRGRERGAQENKRERSTSNPSPFLYFSSLGIHPIRAALRSAQATAAAEEFIGWKGTSIGNGSWIILGVVGGRRGGGMREEEETEWFARWEEHLPSPEELTPLSQTLITPALAIAFDIPIPADGNPSPIMSPHFLHRPLPPPASPHLPPPPDFETSDLNSASAASGSGGGGDEPARTLKRPRLVWTPQLHKRFVDAVAHLGIKNAVPKTIMQLMSVDGLTRENVASHLQKYRLYLKRMQGLSTSGGGGGGGGGPISASDAATDQLFASAPVPHHFLSRRPVAGLGGPDPFLPYMPVTALQHHQQITAAMQQQQHYHQRHLGHFGSPTGGGGFDHGFLNRPAVSQSGMHQMLGAAPGMGLMQLTPSSAASFVDDLEPARGGSGERKVLTLFPTGED